jgi:cytochrome o ubiquinol oxidase operon protein cyoD
MDASGIPLERTVWPYLIGIVLALTLTAIPFALVAMGTLPRGTTLAVILVAAIIQILVHLRFFLHIGLSTPRENLIALAFAAVLILIMVGGTLWIMFDLYNRMMV